MARNFSLKVIVSAVDNVTARVNEINRRINRITAGPRAIANRLQALGEAAGIRQLGKNLQLVHERFGSVVDEAKRLGTTVALVGGVAAAAVWRLVRGVSTAGDRINDMSKQVGFSTRAFQEWEFVAERSGVAPQLFASSVGAFSKRLGELRAGTGGLFTILKRVSPTLLEQLRVAGSNEEALTLLMEAMASLKDPAKQAALASAAFSRAGLPMVNMAQEGAEGIAAMRAEFNRLGGVMGDDLIQQAAAFDDQMVDLNVSLAGLRYTIGAALMPDMIRAVRHIKEWIVANRELIGTRVREWLERARAGLPEFIAGLKSLWSGMRAVGRAIQSVVDFLGGWENAVKVLAVLWLAKLIVSTVSLSWAIGTALVSALKVFSVVMVSSVIPMVKALGIALLTTPVGWFIGAVALIAGAAYLIYKNWEPIKEFFGSLWDDIKFGANMFWEWLNGWLDKMRPVIDALLSPFRLAIQGFSAMRGLGQQLWGMGDAAPTGAPAAIPPGLGGRGVNPMAQRNELLVRFDNAPRGTRVATGPRNDSDVDLSLGFAFGGAP